MKAHKDVIEALNCVLRNELIAINQYFLHARMFDNWGYNRLNDYRYHQSIRVMKEADEIIQRILFLEGLPNMQNLGRLAIGKNVMECLNSDLNLEKNIHHAELVKAIDTCTEHEDYVSRDLLEKLLKHSESSIDWLETQLNLLKEVGLENYLQLQLEVES